MMKRVRNEPDSGSAAEGAMVTYSRLPRGGRSPAVPEEPFERQEPFLDAREVPLRNDDLRAFDPDRAATGADGVVDDLEAPRRGGRKRRRGGFAPVLIGAVALAAGMVILAYAYGVATRVDEPSPLSAGASATAADGATQTRGTLSGDDAARSIPVGAPTASGAAGTPMDGDVAQPSGGAQPALVAPVPATATPAQPRKPAIQPATASAEPPAAKAESAPANNAKPADGADNLMANIERLLQRDGAAAGASDQPGASPAASAGPAPLAPAQPTAAVADPNALPLLPDPTAVAVTPPADIGPQLPKRLIPPADIPNVAPSNTSLDALH